MSESAENFWVYPENHPVLLQKIIREFHIHPVTAQLLLSRGFVQMEEIHAFLYAKLPQLHPPSLLPDIDKAVKRILEALKGRETVLVYADNDVDGMSGAALLSNFLEKIGISVIYHIPNQHCLEKHPVEEAFAFAKARGCSLIITVDCSLSHPEGSFGPDLIITDHHEPTKFPTRALAELNPKLIESTYPNINLTGVGVAFKFAHAILNALTDLGALFSNRIDLKEFLDFVALGTIADMGPLLEENRILVRYGLELLKQSPRIGLRRLFEETRLDMQELSPMDISLKIAPKLNSLGRIAYPEKGVQLLLTTDPKEAEALVEEIHRSNTQRQKMEKKITEDVEALLEKEPQILEEKAIVLCSQRWHPGIIPIIASKIARKYNRPTMVISLKKGWGKGSVRTIEKFPIMPVLKKHGHLFQNFGGHDFAAGFTIEEKQIARLHEYFVEEANKALGKEDLLKKIYLDSRIDFEDITFDFMESINLLKPFGHANREPLFYTQVVQYRPPKIIGKTTHIKMYLEQKKHRLEGIGFFMATRKEALQRKKEPFTIVFTPKINQFYNKPMIQLHVRDFS
ncbi:MAG: single-stranded-DNA-specific exonuclease RecJ [Chlamydiota bacterium]